MSLQNLLIDGESFSRTLSGFTETYFALFLTQFIFPKAFGWERILMYNIHWRLLRASQTSEPSLAIVGFL